jgi:hypothetical protein
MREYCARCGEKRIGEEDLSVRHFLHEAVHTVTNMDSRVGRTFAALLRRPGLLTAEFCTGRRRPYLSPLQVFLVCNVIFFLVNTAFPFNVFSTSLADQLLHHPYSGLIVELPAAEGLRFRELLREPDAFARYQAVFNRTTTTLAKSLVVLMVPIFALLSLLLYRRARRYYVQHLVFALHVYAFMMLATGATGMLFFAVLRALASRGIEPHWELTDFLVGLVMLSILVTYLAAAGRRAFGATRRGAAGRAVVLAFGYFIVLQVYRLILFFATWLSV